jgi:hypothetical protein
MGLKEEALAEGVHTDCWSNGAGGACPECFEKVMDIMDRHYANVHPDDLRSVITTDIWTGKL